MYICWMDSPVGRLCLEDENGALAAVRFAAEATPEVLQGAVQQDTPLLAQARRQLEEYFARRRRSFDLPLAMHGTPFRRQVWQALEEIPYGEVRSYGELAAKLGKPGGARAVGGACHVNPIAIVVPCHRVVGANGALTGYAGGLEIKRYLLQLEQAEGYKLQEKL